MVKVVFDSSNPFRRKSSLAATDTVTPRLRRLPPSHPKTECLVHQFLADQRGPRIRQTSDRDRHRNDGPETCQAEDISAEAGLNRSLDPKAGKGLSTDRKTDDNSEQAGRRRRGKNLRDADVSDSVGDDDEDEDRADGSGSASSMCGQVDERQWQAEMAAVRGASSSTSSSSRRQDRLSAGADAPNSRLLTKKQLSEMAWGVRELSRRLGSVRLKFRVRNIFLLTKIYDAELIAKTRELCRWLLDRERDVRYTVYVDQQLKGNKRFDVAGLLEEVRRDFVASGEVSEEASWEVFQRLKYWDEEMCRTRPHTFDFVVTLGGDGTVLYASWLFQRIVPPVLSFSLGSLGFLTKFDFEDYRKTLTTAFNDGVTVSLRLRFEGTVMRSQKTGSRLKNDGGHAEDDLRGDGQDPPRDLVEELIGEEKDDEHTHRPDGTFEVLNEVVVDRGPNASECSVLALSWFTINATPFQQCLASKSSATTSTSRRSRLTVFASAPRRARPLTASLPAAPCATRRTRSCWSRPSARTRCRSGPSSFQTRSYCAWACPTTRAPARGLALTVGSASSCGRATTSPSARAVIPSRAYNRTAGGARTGSRASTRSWGGTRGRSRRPTGSGRNEEVLRAMKARGHWGITLS